MGNNKVVTLEEQKQFWSEAATSKESDSLIRPTARDPYLQQAVEDSIERWLQSNARLIDIGCGDGHSTLRFSKHVRQALGVDFIHEFITKAKNTAKDFQNIMFEQASVLDLTDIKEKHGIFDIATTIRCLINLCTWENQKAAINQIADIIKPGGLLLASEGWSDGMDGLNLRRNRADLPPIQVVDYNLLMNRQLFEAAVNEHFEIVDYISLGFYIFMSRVFQPAFVQPEQPSHIHDINRIAASLHNSHVVGSEFQDCDYAGIYVLRKRCMA